MSKTGVECDNKDGPFACGAWHDQDDAAMSLASAGSVEPVAWAIQFDGDSGPYIDWDLVWPTREQAENFMSDCTRPDGVVVPLYRSPTLTDAEREAVAYAEDRMDGGPVKATLRGLLSRLGGGE